jgi:hypothetical protein
MRTLLLVSSLFFLLAVPVSAERLELKDGRYVDDQGDIHRGKYSNEDMFAPWNDPLKKDDIFAPWNDSLQKDDMFAPWNDPLAGESETNRYMKEEGETDPDYYWE